MLKLTWDQVAAWRIQRHHLDPRAPADSMLAVAGRLCGLHAQVMSSAELSLWARVEGLDRRAVRRALWEERSLVKTWAMRGTLHLLPACDLPMWHAALATSSRYRSPALWRRFGLTTRDRDRITAAVASALDGQVMTREELAREVGRIVGSKALAKKLAASSWGTLLKPAAFGGHLCFGPSEGQRVRFTRPESWLTSILPPLDPQAAATELTRRYLAAYGPATYRDLARWWGGSSVATIRQWIASLGDEASQIEVAGQPAWMLAADALATCDIRPGRSVSLLPAFDQYVVAASCHAENLLPGDLRGRIFRPQGWISPVLLVNGRMLGVWRHEIKGSRVEVAIESFVKVPRWGRLAAAQEAERFAAFVGGKLSLAWKD